VIFLVALIFCLFEASYRKHKDIQNKTNGAGIPPTTGGEGGKAETFGERSYATGGQGGNAGVRSGGKGGDARTTAPDSIAVGGAGGQGGTGTVGAERSLQIFLKKMEVRLSYGSTGAAVSEQMTLNTIGGLKCYG
jgi:hypothetical protein